MMTQVGGRQAAAQFHTTTIDGVDVGGFYREAREPSKPPIVLLHGFPSSSYQPQAERSEPYGVAIADSGAGRGAS